MALTFKMETKKSGRFKPPNLANPQLTAIGQEMVAAQKKRWAAGLNASGASAKPLSRRYAYYKRRATGNPNAIRDMHLTGMTISNFQLRKAADGIIRAEPTSREARKRATQAQQAEEMIGFAGSDQNVVFRAAQREYGAYLQKAWVPIG